MKRVLSTFGFAYAATAVLALFPASFLTAAERLQNLSPPQTAFSRGTSSSADRPPPPPSPIHGHIPPPAPHGPAPLLYVRLSGPAGLRITFYPGPGEAKEHDAPAIVGLRPGYVYRIKLTGLPGHPNDSLYPTLEVRGSLVLPPGLRAGDFPAPIIFNAEDIEKVLASAYLTKIVALENPDVALPDATQKDQPVEIEVASSKEAMAEARFRGRPMLILRWGERALSADELARQAIPGTILLPDQQTLPPPAVPPCIPWSAMQIFDPILGPRCAEEECLHDGGDVPPFAGINALGQLGGLNPTDTVAVYADSRGRRHIAVSNRVCICVPRFVILRATSAPAGYGAVVEVEQANASISQAEIRTREKLSATSQNEHLHLFATRERPSASQIIIGTRSVDQFLGGAIVFGFVEGQAVLGTLVKPPEERPDLPLLLHKAADKISAQVGDIVTFQLDYRNVGGKPITGIVVSDSLTGRLEYIAGSAKSDRHTTFTTEPNEAGSAVLRWAVTGALPPGQGGTVTFQARIR
jgi:uncharacterized repeat protein (TIGR01451 family)